MNAPWIAAKRESTSAPAESASESVAAGRRMLVIAPEAFFRPHGTPLSVYYRTQVASELGAEIDLLTYGEGRDVDIPGVRIIRIPRFRVLGSVDVGPSLQKLFLDCFIFLWTLVLLLRHDYDFVHAHEESVFFSRFLKPIFGFRLIYDMHSSLPQQLTNFDFTESRLLIGLFRLLERSSLLNADAVITICPALAEQALEQIGDGRRHFLIENTIFEAVEDGSANGTSNESRRRGAEVLGKLPEDRPIILYAGSFEPYQGLDLLVDAFGLIRAEGAAPYLCMVGGRRDQVETLRRRAAGLSLEEDVLLSERVPMATVKECMDRAAVLVSPRTRGSNTPLKIYQQLASGVPLVATRIRSHTQVLDDDVCFMVDPEPESLARGLLRALNDGEDGRRRARNARGLYENRYSRSAYEEKMRDLFAHLG